MRASEKCFHTLCIPTIILQQRGPHPSDTLILLNCLSGGLPKPFQDKGG